jgi:hypothetical protein
MSFGAAFDIEIDPEFPGTGRWSLPSFAFRRDGNGVTGVGVEGFRSTWGRPLVARVRPHDSSEWVGFFEAGGVGGVKTAVIGTPNPHIVCIVNDGAGYLVDIERPETHRVLDVMPVRGSRALPELQLLLLWDWTSAAAIGIEGLVWESDRLCLDDFEGVGVDEIGLVCRGAFMPAEIEEFHVDLTTGRPVDRPPFRF